MKKNIIIGASALISILSLGSCEKNYTCTCTIKTGSVTTTKAHTLSYYYPNDAKKTCNSYQDQGNVILPGSTSCHL